jgi:hypothetical protein
MYDTYRTSGVSAAWQRFLKFHCAFGVLAQGENADSFAAVG